MLEFTKDEKEKVLQNLLPVLPGRIFGISDKWEFQWLHDRILLAKNACYVIEGKAYFTLHFDPYKSLVAFSLHFNGTESQRFARKYKLRDQIDDALWANLPSTESIYSLSKRPRAV